MKNHTHTTFFLLLLNKKNEYEVLVIYTRSKKKLKIKKIQGSLMLLRKFLVIQERFFDSKTGNPDTVINYKTK